MRGERVDDDDEGGPIDNDGDGRRKQQIEGQASGCWCLCFLSSRKRQPLRWLLAAASQLKGERQKGAAGGSLLWERENK